MDDELKEQIEATLRCAGEDGCTLEDVLELYVKDIEQAFRDAGYRRMPDLEKMPLVKTMVHAAEMQRQACIGWLKEQYGQG